MPAWSAACSCAREKAYSSPCAIACPPSIPAAAAPPPAPAAAAAPPSSSPATERNMAFRISSGSRATWPPAMWPVSCASTPAKSPASADCWSSPVLMNSRLPVVTKAFMGRAWISVIRTRAGSTPATRNKGCAMARSRLSAPRPAPSPRRWRPVAPARRMERTTPA
jgi:hypothetical protein